MSDNHLRDTALIIGAIDGVAKGAQWHAAGADTATVVKKGFRAGTTAAGIMFFTFYTIASGVLTWLSFMAKPDPLPNGYTVPGGGFNGLTLILGFSFLCSLAVMIYCFVARSRDRAALIQFQIDQIHLEELREESEARRAVILASYPRPMPARRVIEATYTQLG